MATNGNKKEYFLTISSETPHVVIAMVGKFDISPLGLSHNITTRFQVFGSARHIKKDSTIFLVLNAETDFWRFKSKD